MEHRAAWTSAPWGAFCFDSPAMMGGQRMGLLDGAYARVERVDAHIAEFDERAEAWGNTGGGKAMAEKHLHQLDTLPPHRREKLVADIPPIFGIIAGEAIYNLRAALDYLAHELTFLDSGCYLLRSQFPIEDTRDNWNQMSRKTVEVMSSAHREAIEALQPYSECEWTARLRNLSNPDKHRRLTILKPFSTRQFVLSPPKSKAETPVRLADIDVQRIVSFYIGFDGDCWVPEAVHNLKVEISATLDAFNPDFKAKGF
ncbi:MAG: hypothetical protein ACKVVT_18730 [Dehalococcoidia bacterium]